MDYSQVIMHPGFFVPIALGLIAFIVWLVRLEGKGNATDKTFEKFKEETKGELKELWDELKDTRTRFFEHASNAGVHHNAEAYTEFKTALERRLMGFEGTLKDIGVKLDRIADKQ
jgi:hypothetical protein